MVEELTGKELKRWNLSDYLKTPEDIHYYLEAAVAEDTGDGNMIRAALGDIAQVQERNMTHLAKAAGTTPGRAVQGPLDRRQPVLRNCAENRPRSGSAPAD